METTKTKMRFAPVKLFHTFVVLINKSQLSFYLFMLGILTSEWSISWLNQICLLSKQLFMSQMDQKRAKQEEYTRKGGATPIYRQKPTSWLNPDPSVSLFCMKKTI